MNGDRTREIFNHYEDFNEPDADSRGEICVFDIQTQSVLNLYKDKPHNMISWYPPYARPQLNYEEDVIDNGGGYMIYGYQRCY